VAKPEEIFCSTAIRIGIGKLNNRWRWVRNNQFVFTKQCSNRFLNSSLNYGGAERQLVPLVKSLDKNNFDITVLYFYSGSLEKDLENSGVKTISLKARTLDLSAFFASIRHLKNIQPEIIHGYLSTNLLTIFIKPLFHQLR
jgi:hypothetical protein